jgi:hypothetical protein
MPILAVILLVGLLLLVRGLLGRRVGNEPRCRRCAYNLTGLEAENCPECGAAAAGRNVVTGRRRRRRPSLVVGTLLLLLSATGLGLIGYGQAKRVNWYLHYPKFVLLRKARADDRLAINELTRRVRAGLLVRDKIGDIVPLALAKHGAPARFFNSRSWADLLAAIDRVGGLTTQHKERFYGQFVLVKLEVRPKVRQGDELPVRVWIKDYGTPSLAGEYVVQEDLLRVAGGTHRLCRSWMNGPWPGNSARSHGTLIDVGCLEPGRHAVEYVVTRSVCRGGADPSEREVLWSEQMTLVETVQILAPDAPDPLTLIDAPALAEALKGAIEFRTMSVERTGLLRRPHLEAEILIQGPLPIDVGFEVLALAGDREIQLGRLAHPKGVRGSHAWGLGRDLWFLDAEEITPILRTSRKAASESIGCFEIWGGELRFAPLAVEAVGDESPSEG